LLTLVIGLFTGIFPVATSEMAGGQAFFATE
jgi:hypothetical protein